MPRTFFVLSKFPKISIRVCRMCVSTLMIIKNGIITIVTLLHSHSIEIYMYTHVYAYVNLCTYIHMYMLTCIHVHIYTCICFCACICIHTFLVLFTHNILDESIILRNIPTPVCLRGSGNLEDRNKL